MGIRARFTGTPVPLRSQATFSDESGGWKCIPQLYPISFSNFAFAFRFFCFLSTEISFFCVWHLKKEVRNKSNIFSAINCYKLRVVTVSRSGSESTVPVLKPIAAFHAVILAGISRGGTV